MNTYKLLTPGPLTTTDTVKEEMLVDRCTWDDDYKAVTQKIRRQLLQLGHLRSGERPLQRGGGRRQGPHLLQRGLRGAHDPDL